MQHYVYAHENDAHGVFYVGKGSGPRLRQTGNRTAAWKACAAGKFTAFVLSEHNDDAEAFRFEIDAIANFKRMGLCAANVSLGGKGVTVERRWWGSKISAALTGAAQPRGRDSKSYKDFCDDAALVEIYRNNTAQQIGLMFGVSTPTVIARLQSLGVKTRGCDHAAREIVCTTTGQTFPSVSQAAQSLGLHRENIRKVLSGKYRHTGGLHFIAKDQANGF